MNADDLHTALEGLATERLQRLVDRLEADPGVKVTVGAWRPLCPMVLAGLDPRATPANAPEVRFAMVWDHFAGVAPRRRWLPPGLFPTRAARRSDVQLLLRSANEVLAERAARVGGHSTASNISPAGSNVVTDDESSPR
jgi:hypothetical protein